MNRRNVIEICKRHQTFLTEFCLTIFNVHPQWKPFWEVYRRMLFKRVNNIHRAAEVQVNPVTRVKRETERNLAQILRISKGMLGAHKDWAFFGAELEALLKDFANDLEEELGFELSFLKRIETKGIKNGNKSQQS